MTGGVETTATAESVVPDVFDTRTRYEVVSVSAVVV